MQHNNKHKESIKPDFTMNEVVPPSKKTESILERASKFLESPEGKKSISDYFKREKERKKLHKKQCKKVWQYWKSLSKPEQKELFEKFLTWETKYEEMWYTKRHTQTVFTLWGIFTSIIYDKGKDVTKEYNDEDFLGSAYKYKKYVLKTYCGQGCFDRLYYKGEEIFQTT